MESKSELSKRRRDWVNAEFGARTSGTKMKNHKKAKLLKKLWREAKRDIR